MKDTTAKQDAKRLRRLADKYRETARREAGKDVESVTIGEALEYLENLEQD